MAPDLLEKKSSEGWTPLQIACFTLNNDVISFLISIGANQHSRDRLGRNMMHSLLTRPCQFGDITPNSLRELINHFDKKAVQVMFVERSSSAPGALTPLASWMAQAGNEPRFPEIIKVLSEYSSVEELEMINGEGDLPLHVVRAL